MQLGVLGVLGVFWGSVGVHWGLLKGSAMSPPSTGMPSVQEVLVGVGCWVSTKGWEGVLEGC